VVDDEPDVAELFRQRFRREARQGTYVMYFAAWGEPWSSSKEHIVKQYMASLPWSPLMRKSLPIRLRLPVLTCFPDLESRNLKYLVLIPSGLARISSRNQLRRHPHFRRQPSLPKVRQAAP